MAPRKRPWLRLYVEVIWDRKIRKLDPEHRWLWITVLAVARDSVVPGHLLLNEATAMDADDLADAASLPVKSVKSGLDRLTKLGLIEWNADLGCHEVPKWKERQYESDDVAKRTTKHRSKNADTASMERSIGVQSNGNGTPPENREQKQSQKLSPTGTTLARKDGSRSLSKSEQYADSYLVEIQDKVDGGYAHNLSDEIAKVYTEAWQSAVAAEDLNPKSVGTRLVAAWLVALGVEPDWGRLTKLVAQWGKLSLRGLEAGMKNNPDDPYSYAWSVCQREWDARQAEVSA